MFISSRYRKPFFPCSIDPNWWGRNRGIKLAYAMNEGGGTTLQKLAGTPNGTITANQSSIVWTPNSVGGRQGPHLSFNGASAISGNCSIDDGVTNLITGGGTGGSVTFTISAWVWLNGFANQLYPTIAQFRNDAITNEGFFLKFSNQSTYNGIAWGTSSGAGPGAFNHFYTNTTAKTGQWVHVCLTANGGPSVVGTYTCYENGIALTTNVSGAWATLINASLIGCAETAANTYYLWDGYIEQFLLFNQTLTAEEVKRLYMEPWHWAAPVKRRIIAGVPVLPVSIEPDPYIIYPTWRW